MEHMWSSMKGAINRRSFVKSGLTAAGVATVGAGLLADSSSVLAREGPEEHSGRLTPGDAALGRAPRPIPLVPSRLAPRF